MWWLLNWSDLGHALADVGIDHIRGWTACQVLGRFKHANQNTRRDATKWKRKSQRLNWVQHWATSVSNMICTIAANAINQAIMWTIGDEPIKKERMTWTRPQHGRQRPVLKGTSKGKQGSSKRRMHTAHWYRTTVFVCLLATYTQAKRARLTLIW